MYYIIPVPTLVIYATTAYLRVPETRSGGHRTVRSLRLEFRDV